MRLRKVKEIVPVHLLPGDTIQITYTEIDKDGTEKKTLLIDDTVGRELYTENVAIIDIDAGDFPGYGAGIGGVLLENETQ